MVHDRSRLTVRVVYVMFIFRYFVLHCSTGTIDRRHESWFLGQVAKVNQNFLSFIIGGFRIYRKQLETFTHNKTSNNRIIEITCL